MYKVHRTPRQLESGYRIREPRPLETLSNNPYVRAVSRTYRLIKPALKYAGKTLGYAASQQMPPTHYGRSRSVSRGRNQQRTPRTPRTPRSGSMRRAPPLTIAQGVPLPASRSRSYMSTSSRTFGSSRSRASSGSVAANAGKTGYLGSFKKATRRGANAQGKYTKYGAVGVFETSGSVTDGNAVYLGHCTTPPEKAYTVIVMAILRTLCKQAGIDIVNPNLALPGGFDITVNTKNVATGVTGVGYSGGFSGTFLSQCINISVYFQTNANTADVTFERISLTYSGVPGFRSAQMNLEQYTIDFKGYSTMKIQNRTAPAEDDTADEIDNQPLQGKLYECNSSQPQWRGDGTVTFPVSDATGIAAVAAGAFNELKEPFHPKLIRAAKATNIIINPGQIKTSTVSWQKKSDLNKMLLALGATINNSTVLKSNIGKSKLYGLERVISFGLVNVTVVYECEFWFGCLISKKGSQAMVQHNFL